MGTIRDDDILEDDERVSVERRAATTRWWGGLAGLEIAAVLLVGSVLSFDFSPPMVDDWDARVWGNLEQVARAIRLIGDGSETTADVPAPPIGVDPMIVLTLLVTLGIATTVALGSSLERMEKAREQFLSTEKPTAAAVFRLRNAEMGQAATFVVTMLALVLAHGMVAASFVSMTHPGEVSRHLSWIIAVAGLVMAVFFLIESARLSATAFRSPLRTQPPGGDRAVGKRLAHALVKWARKQPFEVPVADQPDGPVADGLSPGGPVAPRPRRRLWLFGRRIIAATVIVIPCLWLLVPGLLGAGGPGASTRNTPPAIVLAGISLLIIVGYLAARLSADSLRERRAMWWMTFLGTSLLYWFGALTVTAAMALQIFEEGVWKVGAVRAVIVGLFWITLVVMLYERVLGWAALGSRRDLGLRMIVETCAASPSRWKRYVGARMWWARCVLVAIFLVVEIGLALLYVFPVHTGKGAEALVGMALLVLGIGFAASGLAAVAASEFGQPVGVSRLLGAGAWHGERVWQIYAVGLIVLTIGFAQIGRGAAGLFIVPWAAVNLALLLGVLSQFPISPSWSSKRWLTWLRRKAQGPAWLWRGLRTLGDQALAARIRRRRRWIARGIAPDEAWDDKQSMDWARKIVADAQARLDDVPTTVTGEEREYVDGDPARTTGTPEHSTP